MVRPCVARGFHRSVGFAVLHQCIRPLIGACCAPGHHGYQRARVLITGPHPTEKKADEASRPSPTTQSKVLSPLRNPACPYAGLRCPLSSVRRHFHENGSESNPERRSIGCAFLWEAYANQQLTDSWVVGSRRGRPMERFGLRNDQWERIKDVLPGREGHVGGTAEDNRVFVEAVLYRFRTGCPWRDLPERFGHWKSVHQRFGRWAKSGVFDRIFKLLASDHDNEYMMIDATIVRAHQHSAGARKKRRASDRQVARRIDHQNPCARRCLG